MGLAADLGYGHRTANPLHRAGRWVAGTRAGRLGLLPHACATSTTSSAAHRGRHSAPGLLAGLAVLDLTTTGRKSGQRRTSHLIATPYAGTLALLGTNFGQEATPAWALNLEADPQATVTYRGTTARGGRPAGHPGRGRRDLRPGGPVLPSATASYRRRGSATRRAGGSRVFVLDPA